MARGVTSDIKNRKAVTIYPRNDICEAYTLQHIKLQYRLGRYIEKTIHCDAVLTVGMRHLDEVTEEIERITSPARNNNNNE